MAIQNRRGNYTDFNPQKLVPGEWAVVLSGDPNSERGRAVYMAFDVGDVERMATYEDMVENIDSATSDVQEQFTQEVTDALDNAAQFVADNQNTMNQIISNVGVAITNAESATTQANSAAEAASDAADSVASIIESSSAVASWNNRTGIVVPESGDYDSSQITHGSGSVEDALTYDNEPTENSEKAVTSGGLFSIIGNSALGTIASTITGAIAELKSAISGLQANRSYTFSFSSVSDMVSKLANISAGSTVLFTGNQTWTTAAGVSSATSGGICYKLSNVTYDFIFRAGPHSYQVRYQTNSSSFSEFARLD